MTSHTKSKLDAFFDTFKSRHYAKGQVLLLSGDTVREVFYLTSGRVKMYDVSYRGDEIILNVFKPGAFFPMNLVLGEARESQYIYEAETDVELQQAPADEVNAFLDANPDILKDLLVRVYSGLEGLLGRMVYLMSGSAKNRLLYELLIEARRFGTVNEQGAYELTLSEKELGARAGLSRETVSREMHALKASGLVTIGPKEIKLNDIMRLERMLGQDA